MEILPTNLRKAEDFALVIPTRGFLGRPDPKPDPSQLHSGESAVRVDYAKRSELRTQRSGNYYSDLISSEKISIIYGQNLAFVEIEPKLSALFLSRCEGHGPDEVGAEQTDRPRGDEHIGDPEIMRIDLTLTPTLLSLQNFVDQPQQQRVVQGDAYELDDDASTFEALAGRIRLLYKSAYRNLQSEEHLCALIKLQQFVNSISSKNIYKINEKLVKRWQGLEECAMADERQRTVAQFRQSETQADMFEQSLQKVFRYMPDRFRITLRLPGSKTRLAKLMGTRKRFEKLIGDEGLLKNVYTRDLFVDDSRLWAHYKLTFQEKNIMMRFG
uniref:Uncharacterized protein n=1 Tax=Globodera rostochiensis TaxID=31243 RepID=A0A914HUH1_GLORO